MSDVGPCKRLHAMSMKDACWEGSEPRAERKAGAAREGLGRHAKELVFTLKAN